MANFERSTDMAWVNLSEEDLATLEARSLQLEKLSMTFLNRTIEFCEAQQSMNQAADGSCELKMVVDPGSSDGQVGFICKKDRCPDKQICVEFAARPITRRINTETQFRRQFKR